MEFLNKIFNILVFPIKLLIYALIYIYKKLISPLFPSSCIYQPSCSSFMLEAIKKHGLIRGFLLGFKRLLRCNSHNKGGIDPVPVNIKGEGKWIV